MTLRLIAWAGFLTLAACAESANTYPVNQAAFQIGLINIQFTTYGTGSGPITATLPNGEILKGNYAVTDDGTFSVIADRFGTASAYSTSGGKPVEADATDGKVTLSCALRVSFGGHGGGACGLEPTGAIYRTTF